MVRILIIILFVSLIFPVNTLAQTKTPAKSAIPTSDEIQKINSKIDELKNKVASRVAELKLVERRGTVGTVDSVTDTQVIITDLNENRRIIEVDELTKFSSTEDNSFGISDIKKGSRISAVGLYNKESQRLLARFLNEVSIPLFLHGIISEKDEDEFTLTLSTEDGKNLIVDIEKITKTSAYTKGELDDSGFTKILIGQNAIVVGYPDSKDENRITSSRIIIIPDLPKNPKIQIETSSPTPTPASEE